MTRNGNPWDNAACETFKSFMKEAQSRGVYRQEYRDLGEGIASIGDFIEKVHDERRLHSALG